MLVACGEVVDHAILQFGKAFGRGCKRDGDRAFLLSGCKFDCVRGEVDLENC